MFTPKMSKFYLFAKCGKYNLCPPSERLECTLYSFIYKVKQIEVQLNCSFLIPTYRIGSKFHKVFTFKNADRKAFCS